MKLLQPLYECHITTTVAFSVVAELVASRFTWKTSEIKRDPVLGDASFFYLTSYSDDYEIMCYRMKQASNALRTYGAPVLREKIEQIIYDTKRKNYDTTKA